MIFHQSKLGDWEVFSLHAVVTLTAIWCLVRPSATDRLLLMLAHLVSVVVDMPLVVNHWLCSAFLELGLFVALGVGWARASRGCATEPSSTERSPRTSGSLVVLRPFAALAKVNAGFLDPP